MIQDASHAEADAGTEAGTEDEGLVTTGTVGFRGYRTWYCVVRPSGTETGAPLVILHGGPGMAHDYTIGMRALAGTGRRVVFYDQLGCGRSTHVPDAPADFWNVELFVDELRNLVTATGLHGHGGFHLLGQSWGGMLAPEYALRHPDDVRSLVLADAPASMARWTQSTTGLLRRLPADVRRVVARHETAGTTGHPDYLAAVDAFYRQFLCRVHPWPDGLMRSFRQLEADPTVYQTMIGPSEFHVTGTLRDWSIIDRLGGITAPTLVLAGAYDEAQPAAWRPFIERIPDVRHHVFPDASHTPHIEAAADFTRIVSQFIRESDDPT